MVVAIPQITVSWLYLYSMRVVSSLPFFHVVLNDRWTDTNSNWFANSAHNHYDYECTVHDLCTHRVVQRTSRPQWTKRELTHGCLRDVSLLCDHSLLLSTRGSCTAVRRSVLRRFLQYMIFVGDVFDGIIVPKCDEIAWTRRRFGLQFGVACVAVGQRDKYSN